MLKFGRHEEAMSCYYRSIELEPLFTKECYLRDKEIDLLRNQAAFASNADNEKCL